MPGILRRTRVDLEITLRPPGYFVDFLNFASDFAPDQLSDSGKLASFQNGAPNTLCFPGNFRKRKVLGTLCFPFCLPENLVQAKQLFERYRPKDETAGERTTRVGVGRTRGGMKVAVTCENWQKTEEV